MFSLFLGQKIVTELEKTNLIDTHYKIVYRPVRTECFSYYGTTIRTGSKSVNKAN